MYHIEKYRYLFGIDTVLDNSKISGTFLHFWGLFWSWEGILSRVLFNIHQDFFHFGVLILFRYVSKPQNPYRYFYDTYRNLKSHTDIFSIRTKTSKTVLIFFRYVLYRKIPIFVRYRYGIGQHYEPPEKLIFTLCQMYILGGLVAHIWRRVTKSSLSQKVQKWASDVVELLKSAYYKYQGGW